MLIYIGTYHAWDLCKNRIEGTEWFKNLRFEDVVQTLKGLMASESYIRCSEVRGTFYEKYSEKGWIGYDGAENEEIFSFYKSKLQEARFLTVCDSLCQRIGNYRAEEWKYGKYEHK